MDVLLPCVGALDDGQAEEDAQGNQPWMGGGQALPSDIAF